MDSMETRDQKQLTVILHEPAEPMLIKKT